MRTKSSHSLNPLQASPPSSSASYPALVLPHTGPQTEPNDEAHPFRYSKEEMLRIYRENVGKGSLGLEVERWEGVVREVASEPIGLRELSEAEKKASHSVLSRLFECASCSPCCSSLPGHSIPKFDAVSLWTIFHHCLPRISAQTAQD
jgi:hypothetical protein